MHTKNKMTIKDMVMRICILILIFLMITVVARFFTRQILVKKLGVDNLCTRVILSGTTLNDAELDTSIDINWAELYPFEEVVEEKSQYEDYVEKITALENRVISMEEKINDYTSDHLVGYQNIVEVEKTCETYIGWDSLIGVKSNSIVELEDGMLAEMLPKVDVNTNVEAVAELSNFCEDEEIPFIYVQAPHKISSYEDAQISGIFDFSNQNVDELLSGLEENEVSYLDLREEIYKQGKDYHSLFYRTDHHWRAETGLWVSAILTNKLNNEYNFEIDESLLKTENYEFKEYNNWFLGSYGKRVTLARTVPDDFVLIYPKFETEIHYEIPSREMDIQGDFSVFYDMKHVDEKKYYQLSPYSAYNYGDNPLTVIHNLKSGDGKRVLFIKDSFADCVIPFFSQGIEYTEVLDLRQFTGSMKDYLVKTKPDVVIVLYNPSAIIEVEYATHKATFDFR